MSEKVRMPVDRMRALVIEAGDDLAVPVPPRDDTDHGKKDDGHAAE